MAVCLILIPKASIKETKARNAPGWLAASFQTVWIPALRAEDT